VSARATALGLSAAVAACSLSLDFDRLRREESEADGGGREAGADAEPLLPPGSIPCGSVRPGVPRWCGRPSVCCVTDEQPRCTAPDACDPASSIACDEPGDCDLARPICCSRGTFPLFSSFCVAESAAAQCDRALCEPRANTCGGATPDCVPTTAAGAAGTYSKCEPHAE